MISGEGEITLHLRISGKTSSRQLACEFGLWWKRKCSTVVDKKAGHSFSWSSQSSVENAKNPNVKWQLEGSVKPDHGIP